ncbi:TadE/TadG family type IV pilus assembly protein [Vibrio natriegens]|uniref:TadE/TadG family type IV pilus assembly protein n=1 Tax=Vibrio natriegens TaxID=691 RepID=UPI003909A290
MKALKQISFIRGGKKKQTGLAALEFTICLPVLLMLVVLLIDVGRAFIQYTEINKALQNGVRYAVVDTYGTLDFSSIAEPEKIKNVVVYGSPIATGTPVLRYIEPGDVDVVEKVTDEGIKEVVVSTKYDYKPIFSRLPFTDSSLAFEIGASTKMRTSP